MINSGNFEPCQARDSLNPLKDDHFMMKNSSGYTSNDFSYERPSFKLGASMPSYEQINPEAQDMFKRS
jgi:hypothetical protein